MPYVINTECFRESVRFLIMGNLSTTNSFELHFDMILSVKEWFKSNFAWALRIKLDIIEPFHL